MPCSVFRQTLINKNDWDSLKQRAKLKCKETIVINNQLQSIRQVVFEAHRIISDQGVYATVEMTYQKIIDNNFHIFMPIVFSNTIVRQK